MKIDAEELGKSVAAKLEHARDHVRTLEREVKEFGDLHVAVARTVEADGRRHVVRWEKFSPAPDRLGLIMGDAAHNTRSALDHLAWAIALAGAADQGIVLSESEERAIQFPTAKARENFASGKTRFLKCVPDEVVEYIEHRQPFTLLPKDPEHHFLARLSSLDNLDKHRTLLPSVVIPTISSVNWPTRAAGTTPIWPDESVLEAGREICRFEFDEPYTAADLPIDFPFTVGIAGQGPHSAVFVLHQLIGQVESLIQDIFKGARVHGSLIFYPDQAETA